MSTANRKAKRHSRLDGHGEILDAALAYAARDLPVFPCEHAGKRPITRNGFKDATTDPATIRRWWLQYPDANIGVPTGAVSGLVVLDADGGDGLTELKALGTPATTWLARTGRGYHQFFRHPGAGVKIGSRRFRPDLDVKADGGYVIIAPSVHVSGRRYEWLTPPNGMALAPLPEHVLERLTATTKGDGLRSRRPDQPDDWAGLLAGVKEGQRHADATRIAGHYLGRGTPPAEVEQILLGFAARCRPPFDAEGVRRIVRDLAARDSAKEERPTLTDAGNAQRFARQHGAIVRYCYEWRRFLIWNDARWHPDAGALAMRLAKETARSIYAEATGEPDPDRRKKIAAWAAASESGARLRAMLALAQSEPGVPVESADLDRDPSLLNVENGTLNLRSGELRPHQREDLITKLAPVAYDPASTCPLWLAFFERIFEGNEHLIAYVQRAAGYSLTGYTSEQCLFMPYGTGANGKTTLLSVLQALCGEYAIGTRPETLMVKGPDAIPNDVARLRGARLAVAVEAEEGRRFAESLVKQMTGGDVITARFMRAEFFDFTPSFKLWLATNHKPVIRGTDHAIWRRIRLIPFTVTIPEGERDRHFKDKLRPEWPGILRWAVEGCLAWQREGLGEPEEVRAATEGYRAEMDVLGDFIAEVCVMERDARVSSADLYGAYTDWCRATGERWPLAQKTLGTKLIERGFASKKIRRHHVWLGLRLRTLADAAASGAGQQSVESVKTVIPDKPLEEALAGINGGNGLHALHGLPGRGLGEPEEVVYQEEAARHSPRSLTPERRAPALRPRVREAMLARAARLREQMAPR